MQRHLLGILALLLLVSLSACSPAEDPAEIAVSELRESFEGKNVLMILLDAGAYRHFGFAGYQRNTTPNIDALAARSLVFDSAYSPAASTSHAVFSLLTSTHSFLHEEEGLQGREGDAFRVTDETQLMPELLAERFPRRLGITSNNWFGPAFGLDRGFTEFFETYDKAAVPDSTKRRAGRTLDIFRRDLEHWDEGPTFAYLHFLEPHTPYRPPMEFARQFDPVAADSVDASGRALLQYRLKPPSKRKREMIRALYDGNLAYVDAVVGEIFQLLEESNHADDTVVVIIADHGEAFWQHGVWAHGRHIYDEFTRIPFVMHIPGRPELAGRRIPQPVSLIDLLPTYLDGFGLQPLEIAKGKSLLPLVVGATEEFENRSLYLRNTHGNVPEFGLRNGRYKWIYRPYQRRYMLFDMIADPVERHDLVAEGRVPPGLTHMREEVALWLASGSKAIEPVTEMDPETREQLKAIGYF